MLDKRYAWLFLYAEAGQVIAGPHSGLPLATQPPGHSLTVACVPEVEPHSGGALAPASLNICKIAEFSLYDESINSSQVAPLSVATYPPAVPVF
jgi:hypothetical protein